MSHPIPFRTRPLNLLALMVLCLKTRESKSSPDLLTTYVAPCLCLFVVLEKSCISCRIFFLSLKSVNPGRSRNYIQPPPPASNPSPGCRQALNNPSPLILPLFGKYAIAFPSCINVPTLMSLHLVRLFMYIYNHNFILQSFLILIFISNF